jgi:hypothetical protein
MRRRLTIIILGLFALGAPIPARPAIRPAGADSSTVRNDSSQPLHRVQSL